MKRAFIACGGTGGHLSPGVALAEELVSRNCACTLLISNKQVDSRLVRKYHLFKYESLAGSPLSARPIPLMRFAINLVRGTVRCLSLIRKERPDVVIGFGGFLSMPALLAAFLARVPTAVHEANRVAGRVTRVASLFVDRIYLPQGVPLRTARSSRIRYVAMPVRREIRAWPRSKARRALGLDPDKKTLVIMGGSQGAESLNAWVQRSSSSLAERAIQVFCLTGGQVSIDSSVTIKSPKGEEIRFVFQRFSDEMATVLSAADLVVSRAGAGSIAELLRCRAPAILIPYPHAADNHQAANARNFERLGCGVAMEQEYLSGLLEEVKDIIYNEWLLQRFRANLEAADAGDAQAAMARDIEAIVGRGATAALAAPQGGRVGA